VRRVRRPLEKGAGDVSCLCQVPGRAHRVGTAAPVTGQQVGFGVILVRDHCASARVCLLTFYHNPACLARQVDLLGVANYPGSW
jgi:hypothetical protein